MNFMAVKESGKRSGFVIYSYLKDSAFTAVKRDAKGVFERGVLSTEGIRKDYPFLSKIVFKKDEGLDHGDEPLATKSLLFISLIPPLGDLFIKERMNLCGFEGLQNLV